MRVHDAIATLLLSVSVLAGSLQAQCEHSADSQARLLRATVTPFAVNPLTAQTQTLRLDQPARLVGAILATGGEKNDIQFTVVSANETIFASGMEDLICVDLRLQPGSYTLVYDNSSSLLFSKTVWSGVRLEPVLDAPRRDPEATDRMIRTESARRRALAEEVVNVLKPVYKDLIRQLGIERPPASPHVVIEYAVYEIAERNPALYQQILAAFIAHNMAHALQAALLDAGFDPQRASLWREIRDSAIPTTEPEIDRLTLTMLCRSGYGNAGLVALLNQQKDTRNKDRRRSNRMEHVRQKTACDSQQSRVFR